MDKAAGWERGAVQIKKQPHQWVDVMLDWFLLSTGEHALDVIKTGIIFSPALPSTAH